MSKRRKTYSVPASLPSAIANELATMEDPVKNGLADAIGFGSFPQNQGSPFTEQIESTTTLFKNLRWYLVSNFRQLLSQAYAEIGLVQTITDVPVDDGLRGGIKLKSKQLDEEQLEGLKNSLDTDDDLTTAGQAAKWNRLFGGAGIMIFVDDQDPEEELNIAAIGPDSGLEFRAADMWELFWDKQNTEGYDPAIQAENFSHYNYYGEQVHTSRVMRLTGITAPSFIRPRLRGWGLSVVEALIRSMNQYLKATDLGFEVLDEFKLDIYKIKNLTNTLLSPLGDQQVKKRVTMANWQKNYQNAIVMDSEDDFDHKQLSFAGLGEAMAGIRMQVAADMRMPLTKLFGISASGFNSGEDDIEVYNAMVEAQVRNKLKYNILRICELKCQKLFGFIPDDLTLSFEPLRVLSAEQEENVKTAKWTRLLGAVQAGLISTEEFRDAVNKGNLFDVSLDTTGLDDGGGFDQDTIGDDDEEEPSANKPATQKSPKGKQAPEAKDPPEPKTLNSITAALKPYSREQRIDRVLKNSAAFDKAAYEADGGDDWIESGRKELFMNPGKVDEALWARAKEASQKAFGNLRWQFVVYWYKKQGGKFE